MWLACDCLIIINKSPEERVYSFTLETYTQNLIHFRLQKYFLDDYHKRLAIHKTYHYDGTNNAKLFLKTLFHLAFMVRN